LIPAGLRDVLGGRNGRSEVRDEGVNKVIAAVVGVLAPALTGVAAARPQIVDGVFRAGTKRGRTDEPEDELKELLPLSSPLPIYVRRNRVRQRRGPS